ncbi:hypothetical protein [Persicitalea sp.]|uniref:hypothetical protein n=1 Tax=Persicitalea sp. TaxID=3100273 RepID=UPI0035942A9F
MPSKLPRESSRGLDLEQLLEDFIQKIEAEWPKKWTSHGLQFAGVERLPSKNAFYHDLADALNEAYKERYGLATAAEKEIKAHTVRRVMEEGPGRNFDDKTCDLLAVYLGYANWPAYQMRHRLKHPLAGRLSSAAKWGLAGVLALVILLGLGSLFWQRDGAIPPDDERLTLVKISSAKAPAKVLVRYDLRGLDPRQTYIVCGKSNVVPQLEQGQLTFEVLLAQSAPVQLFVEDELVCEIPVMLETEGWEGYLGLRIPLEKSSFYRDGLLHSPRNLVPNDSREDYYPAFINFRDYGLAADAMCFEARVLNNEKIGGQWAYDVSVDLVGSRHRAYFNVLAPDAILYARAGVAETELSGSKNPNLKALGIKMDDWCVLSMQILGHEAVILIDGQEALRFPYREELGDLRGIQFYIKGSGAVDWVRVTDLKDGKVKYFDDFLGEKTVAGR